MSVKKPNFLIPLLSLTFLFGFTTDLYADTIYLKNGRSIEGIIKNEDEAVIEMNVGFGVVKVERNQVERVTRSTPDETIAIYQRWEKKRLQDEERSLQKEKEPREVKIKEEAGRIVVDALLNASVSATLILDTGASFVVLSNKIAKKLEIDTDAIKETVQLQLADGRKLEAKHTVLESIDLEGVKAKNVDVAILPKESEEFGSQDGLLGMSFLNRYNFKIERDKKQLILEKIK